MTRTVVVTGKIGPAFDGHARILCTSCRKDFITYKPGAMFGPRKLDFSARIFGTCDNCENLRRHTANTYTDVRSFFDEADYARLAAPMPCEKVLVSPGTFTMCTCPDGKQCNSCK